jgi:hypothetical protein
MAGERTFKFKFTGDADDLSKATGGVERDMNGLGGKLATAAKTIAGAIAAAFVIDKVVSFGSALYDIGNQADIWNKKAGIVFGDQIDVVNDWADEVAGSMGMTQSELVGASAAMADLLVPMGMSREAAAEMSMDLGSLSGALSAWSGGTRTATDVNETLAKALLGEREELKALGISINQAEVNERALAVAKADGREEVTKMDEALATQQLIMEKSVDAQTAWADGTFDAQKKQAELSAKIAEVKEALGTALLPVVQAFTAWLVDRAIPAMQNFRDWMWPKIQDALGSLRGWWDENGPAIVEFADSIRDAAIDIGEGFQDAWATYIQPAYISIKDAWADLADSMSELRSAVVGDNASMGESWKGVGAAIGFVVAGILVALTFVINKASVVATQAATVTDGIKSAWQGVQDRFNGVRDALQSVYDKWINLKNAVAKGINWPSIPSWASTAGGGIKSVFSRHSGGIVPGPSGATVPILAQAGEMVRSAAQVRQDRRNGGGGGMSITVNAYGTTGREMVAEIERAVRDGARAGWLSSAGVTP